MGLEAQLQTTVQVTIIRGTREGGTNLGTLLWTTGGKLELSKCLYYLLFYTFDDDGTLHKKGNQHGSEHVNLTSGLFQFKTQSTIGTTLKRIER
jgi:hypothetical protein